MIFNTFAYFFFFLLPTVAIYRLVRPAVRPWVCGVSGVLFFLYFSYTALAGLPAAACVLIFAWELAISRLYKPGSWFCWLGVAQSIVILIIFKYWNFITGTMFLAGAQNPLFWPGAFLPLGVSFFTFEFIHYAVDRYYGKVEKGRFSEYFAFIFFFPTMVAGPIKRYQNFIPSLQKEPVNFGLDFNRGTTRILCGLTKKFMVADLLTAVTDHLNTADIARADRSMLLVWLLAYGIKIYFDFSGYSDIAIGSARLFGMRVPENFDWPYLQTNISEFWKHWHISLYRWLIDYVFIPLGGSRVSTWKIYRNIIITMVLSGLWHGAGGNFLLWGAWHGMLLSVYRAWSTFRARFNRPAGRLETVGAWALTFVCVQIGWAFFSMNLQTCSAYFHRLFLG